MNSPPKLSILVVSFNTRALTLACLQSIKRFPPSGPYEVIVIDNASQDGTAGAITEGVPWAHLIASTENLGFAKANNLGMREACGDILVLLNSDTEVHPEALSILQSAFRDDPGLAAAGGKLLNSDGSLQHGLRYFPSLSNALSEALFLHHLFHGPLWSEVEARPAVYEEARSAEWLSGAYLAVRKSWYEKVGGLDAGFFMYSEDTDWCWRIHQGGGVIRYLPDSLVTHHGGGSSGGNPDLHIMRFLAKDRFARIHFTSGMAALYRLGLVAGLLLRGLLCIPVSPLGARYRQACLWRLKAAVDLFTHPLPPDASHD